MAKNELLSWISVCILPHESMARRWLRRFGADGIDEDDIVQEAYVRIAGLSSTAHIHSGRAYLMTTVRNLALEHLRRKKLVRVDAMAEIDQLNIIDDRPSAEDELSGRQRLMLVRQLIDALPDRCRDVFILRKIEGLSQRQTAERLGLSENIIEKQTAIGLKAILRQIADLDLSDVLPPKG